MNGGLLTLTSNQKHTIHQSRPRLPCAATKSHRSRVRVVNASDPLALGRVEVLAPITNRSKVGAVALVVTETLAGECLPTTVPSSGGKVDRVGSVVHIDGFQSGRNMAIVDASGAAKG